jgi:hypothetical protein
MSKPHLSVTAYCIIAMMLSSGVYEKAMPADDRKPILPQMVILRGDTANSASFQMSTHEVTWRQYLQSVDQARCPMPEALFVQSRDNLNAADPRIRDNHPVTGVGASHVRCYIAWLNRSTSSAYRLPTLGEWQYAARNVQPRLWSSMERAAAASAVRSDPRVAVRQANVQVVGSGTATTDGIFDLEGNADELVSDLHPLTGRELERCGREQPNALLITGFGGYDVERQSGKEIPSDFRAVGHSICGIPMKAVGFRLAASLFHAPVRLKPH